MLQRLLKKYAKSSRLANAASWEVLFARTSTMRRVPDWLSSSKNRRADFPVKPIVQRFTFEIRLHSRGRVVPRRMQSAAADARQPLR